MDQIMDRTVVHRGKLAFPSEQRNSQISITYYADDVALLIEMLDIIMLAMEIMDEEASPFGLEINWLSTKI